MTVMTQTLIALVVLVAAFAFGPALFPVRAGLRGLGAVPVRRYQSGATVGLYIGMSGAVLLAPLSGVSPLLLAALSLLALLAASDLAWRWLPPLWTVLLGLLALVQVDCLAHAGVRLLDAALVATSLIVLRQVFLALRGVEALGWGDVWLAAAITLHLGLLPSFQALGLAAFLGLATAFILPLVGGHRKRRLGVAFGTHICVISALFFLHSAKIQTFSYSCPQ